MGKPTKAEQAKAAATTESSSAAKHSEEQDAEARQREDLVAMELNGEEIFVHPTCVDDHARIGWKLV